MAAKGRMKHTDHPNWKNLSPREKNIVRQRNYWKASVEAKIRKIERYISEDKENGKPTFLLEGLLRKEKCSLVGGEEQTADESLIGDLKNMILDYEINSGKRF